ncbi:DeoR/GlpR family DNA-binding transcription regulator [Streptococcus panodentis]|uniref:Lactose phosphotransferase system repressor n=1 Tax=Streptococcus panodentis TaxID=1581472 RepID=A0ABS5AXG2_9STRE|nr:MULTISPECIES: DeoR/GlpR family DNA-binding transcription regulator [Streptococcus]KXT82121.1 Lactose phosphotransferase system repressor [Streptococcus sp. DD11]MBP2621262.1 DeoR family transcriptional regulator [Streptococcus panodentis]
MKESRHRVILQELDQTGVVSVKNLKELLDVTDMTIRRDLIDLEKQGLLTRVHGGAHKKVKDALNEVSHSEKQMINIEEKKLIAKKCAALILNGDTVFIGSGTTTDFISDYLDGKSISIVTNSLPIFEKLKDRPNLDLILIGGRYRVKTQTFVGQFANNLLKEIKVSKAFIGVNGIDGHNVTTTNEEEGNGDAIILNNAIEKYIVADNSKFDSYSFYTFYRLDNIDAIITDENLSPKVKEKYSSYTKVL